MRLIDADKMNLLLGISDRDIYAKRMLDHMDTVDAAPVSHGKWVPMYRSGVKVERGYVSTCCDMWAERKSPYCPHCGARMDGAE